MCTRNTCNQGQNLKIFELHNAFCHQNDKNKQISLWVFSKEFSTSRRATISSRGTGRLNEPLAVTQIVKPEFLGNLCGCHCVRQVLLVCLSNFLQPWEPASPSTKRYMYRPIWVKTSQNIVSWGIPETKDPLRVIRPGMAIILPVIIIMLLVICHFDCYISKRNWKRIHKDVV